ncbi:helix-turn-helix transcriptional regulator [uncultured Hymenobacter sp.]|uniref:helix-turn-helix transcriptional regulator n=1 Tax=uncultured Hymenobacter sp. TaxID=170016 RepID=UPI0035CB66DC
MTLELQATQDNDFLTMLAAATDSPLENGCLTLAAALGTGYIQALDFGPRLHLTIYQCELKEAVRLRKTAFTAGKGTIIFSFRHLVPPDVATSRPLAAAAPRPRPLPTVRVSSADMNFEFYSPANTTINALVLAADVALFAELLPPTEVKGSVQTLLSGGQTFLYEEIISPTMQAVAAQLVAADAPAELRRYYLKVKAEELIYLFLVELLKRQHAPEYPLSVADAQQLYRVRDQVLKDLSIPPNLPALASFTGLSESKMKRLFKQVFGTSIYSYYQTVRMQEAAQLLQEGRFTVSEVGNQLGFINLSHFTRLFERHVGLRPKQYSRKIGVRISGKAG